MCRPDKRWTTKVRTDGGLRGRDEIRYLPEHVGSLLTPEVENTGKGIWMYFSY